VIIFTDTTSNAAAAVPKSAVYGIPTATSADGCMRDSTDITTVGSGGGAGGGAVGGDGPIRAGDDQIHDQNLPQVATAHATISEVGCELSPICHTDAFSFHHYQVWDCIVC
jgi:hypothetical protein